MQLIKQSNLGLVVIKKKNNNNSTEVVVEEKSDEWSQKLCLEL